MVLYVDYIVEDDNIVKDYEAYFVILFYLAYIAVIVIEQILMHYAEKKMERDLKNIMATFSEDTQEKRESVQNLRRSLASVKHDLKVDYVDEPYDSNEEDEDVYDDDPENGKEKVMLLSDEKEEAEYFDILAKDREAMEGENEYYEDEYGTAEDEVIEILEDGKEVEEEEDEGEKEEEEAVEKKEDGGAEEEEEEESSESGESEDSSEKVKKITACKQLLFSIFKLDTETFKRAPFLLRFYTVIMLPCTILFSLVLPVINLNLPLNGWSRILNSFHIISLPIFVYVMSGK